uniref:Eukaryotic translation initiation factor 3 subunit K n=1 Tax=Equus caballus TaxID=9796 RepID=F6SVK2_HORSE
MAMFEQMRANVGKLLKGIDRYNPENLATLERYVETQAKENAYDLEANLAVLKLYQFNPAFFQTTVTAQILLKALTNLPHTDFTLCKCMIDQAHQEERPIRQILYLGDLLETCHFQAFWVTSFGCGGRVALGPVLRALRAGSHGMVILTRSRDSQAVPCAPRAQAHTHSHPSHEGLTPERPLPFLL